MGDGERIFSVDFHLKSTDGLGQMHFQPTLVAFVDEDREPYDVLGYYAAQFRPHLVATVREISEKRINGKKLDPIMDTELGFKGFTTEGLHGN